LAKIIDQRIYIRADGDTPYRNVVFAMNRLQDEGFYKVALVGADKRR
jgi:biopolymer transport protein ExbD